MKGISTAVLSKDRPLFLRDYLKSLRGMKLNITVFYLASEPKYEEAYLKIFKGMKNIRVVKQVGKMVDYMREWLNEANEYLFICVDDNICKQPFNMNGVINFMEKNKDVFAFNLAVDPDITHSPDSSGSIGKYERHRKIILYYPATCIGMWDNLHTFEVSIMIHRKTDIERIWKGANATVINDLESDGRPSFLDVKKMACFDYAPITNIHVDSMYSYNLSGIVERVTNAEAFTLYQEGREIDVKKTFKERDRLKTTNVTELFLKPKKHSVT